ncbi:MAG: NADH:flavin oxidoreductase [Pseudomonadota bacterium]
MSTEKLFQPTNIRSLELRNRVVMAPMTRQLSPGNFPNEDVIEYYVRRAEGGTGLIISEGTCVDHPASNGYPDVPYFYGEKALKGWKVITEKIHQHGCAFFPQLWHVGAMRETGSQPDPKIEAVSPSGLIAPGVRHGRTMTLKDIEDVIGAFGRAARSAADIETDGVEIHGAHGYLIDQFFWEGSNHRMDKYGGGLVERSRFASEIITEVRRNLNVEQVLSFRMSQWKQQEFQARLAQSPKELEALLMPLVSAGVDVFHCSTRRFWEPEFEESDLNLAGWVKKITGKPTITVGSVGLDAAYIESDKKTGVVQIEDLTEVANFQSLDRLTERLSREEFDLVAVGRAMLANPDWANKVKQKRFNDLRPFQKSELGELL